VDLKQQFLLFAVNIGTGFLFGVFYDLYRAINRRFGFGLWFTQVGDLAAWMVLGGAIFKILQRTSSGEFRGFVLVALGLGVLGYRGSVRKIVMRVLWVLVDAAARALFLVRQIVSWLFRILYRLIDFLLLRSLRALAASLIKVFKRIGKKILKKAGIIK
jgi:spore cortex biosynthesis protein YabQ